MEKRKVGRPKDSGEYGETIQFRASQGMKRKVWDAASQSNQPVTTWIRQAIEKALEK